MDRSWITLAVGALNYILKMMYFVSDAVLWPYLRETEITFDVFRVWLAKHLADEVCSHMFRLKSFSSSYMFILHVHSHIWPERMLLVILQVWASEGKTESIEEMHVVAKLFPIYPPSAPSGSCAFNTVIVYTSVLWLNCWRREIWNICPIRWSGRRWLMNWLIHHLVRFVHNN